MALLVAAGAAGVAALADSKPLYTVVWAAVGGVGTAFAPTLWEWLTRRAELVKAAENVAELLPGDGFASLLHPSRQVVPFQEQGRQRELAELLTWCRDPEQGRLRLVTGPGGVGKSRLAVEVGARLGNDWAVVEIRDDAESDALSKWRAAHGAKVLMVVDYAETRTDLVPLLQEVAAEEGRPVRVLLLARSAGEWWQRLAGESARVRQMVTAAGQGMHLAEDVTLGVDPRQEVRRAVPYFADELGVTPPARVEVELGGDTPRMLDLHAAALVAVLRSARSGGAVVRVQPADVLEELLGHERRYWLQSARVMGLLGGGQGLSPEMIGQIVAAGTLLGARDRSQAVQLVERIPRRPAGVDAGRVADWVRELYPPADDQEWWGRLRPDRLAELHVTRYLTETPALLDVCMEGVDERQRRQALVTLARAAQELDAAGELLQRLLPKVAGEVGSVPASRETLIALYEALPYPTVLLADAHMRLARRLLHSLPADADPGQRARWLSALGIHLAAVGRPADALLVIEQAVDIRRELATAHPDRYRPDLATSLTNLGIRLAELGRPADALTATQQAVDVYRELATAHPDRYRPDLAGSLTNLGNCLGELGRPADALTATQQAVDVYRELATAHPDRYRPDLATCLTNLGNCLAAVGRPADALTATQQAVDIYRELATAHPDRYRPDLATSLNNLGNRLAAVGRPTDALVVIEQAVTLLGELAAHIPERFGKLYELSEQLLKATDDGHKPGES
ncbi:molecular chaperone Tir [Microbispora amethystogenes]|nr:molecular chaperone Tir [Microbispora amethystogenes]